MSQPNEQRPGAFRCVLPDIDETCDGCGAPIPAGDVIIVADFEAFHVTCPQPWTPTLIHGNRQPTDETPLPFRHLQAVT